MDNLNTTSPAPDNSADLQQQLDSLRQLVASVLVIVFILAGAVNIYFYRQVKSVKGELAPLKPQAAQINAAMNETSTAANEFVRRLVEYGKTHPDYMPILRKYNLLAPPTNAAATAVKSPAPVKK